MVGVSIGVLVKRGIKLSALSCVKKVTFHLIRCNWFPAFRQNSKSFFASSFAHTL